MKTENPMSIDTSSLQVGVVGLGSMGLGMAGSLRAAGHEVGVSDVRHDAAVAFAAEGGTAHKTVADLAPNTDVLISVVVNAAQTEAVLFGTQGYDGAIDHLKPGSVFVMCSTVDPQWSAALAGTLAEREIHFLDAPISGGAVKAAAGQLTMMTSGSPEAYALADPYLEAMSEAVYRLGDQPGMGSAIKIVNQLLAGVHIAAAAEAMAFGIRCGLRADDIYDVITHSAGNSWMFENRMAHVVSGDYTPHSAVDIFVKDLGLVLDAARPNVFPLPLAAAAHQQFLRASAAGHGREDDSSVIKTFPGIDLPRAEES